LGRRSREGTEPQTLTGLQENHEVRVTIEKQGLEGWRDDKESADFDQKWNCAEA
jgi:hypothetical protein